MLTAQSSVGDASRLSPFTPGAEGVRACVLLGAGSWGGRPHTQHCHKEDGLEHRLTGFSSSRFTPSPPQSGYTPLHQAAQQGHTHIINVLLQHGARPDATTTVRPPHPVPLPRPTPGVGRTLC